MSRRAIQVTVTGLRLMAYLDKHGASTYRQINLGMELCRNTVASLITNLSLSGLVGREKKPPGCYHCFLTIDGVKYLDGIRKEIQE